MGTNQSTNKLSYYGTTTHPIVGQVTAFLIKGEVSKFVMKTKMKVNQQQINLFEKIGRQKNNNLICYYGTQFISQNKQIIQIKGQKEIYLYWQLLNFDLTKQISHLIEINQNIAQDSLWQIMENILSASKYLQQFNIYLDLRPNKIQFSAGREPKAYWADILPNNMHRAYERFIHLNEFRHTIYSPEQLLQINRTQRKQLNREKCVMFNLGVTLLEATSKLDVKRKIYNFPDKKMSQVKKRQIMDKIYNLYSEQFWEVLCGLLEYFPNDRFNFKDLEHRINKHFNRKQQQGLSIQLFSNQQKQQKQQQKTQKSSQQKQHINMV